VLTRQFVAAAALWRADGMLQDRAAAIYGSARQVPGTDPCTRCRPDYSPAGIPLTTQPPELRYDGAPYYGAADDPRQAPRRDRLVSL